MSDSEEGKEQIREKGSNDINKEKNDENVRDENYIDINEVEKNINEDKKQENEKLNEENPEQIKELNKDKENVDNTQKEEVQEQENINTEEINTNIQKELSQIPEDIQEEENTKKIQEDNNNNNTDNLKKLSESQEQEEIKEEDIEHNELKDNNTSNQKEQLEVTSDNNESSSSSFSSLNSLSGTNFEKNPMYLFNPSKVNGMKKYIVYTLGGSSVPEQIMVRYSDFFTLREKLQLRWPGIYIPNIPPKQIIGNMDTKTIFRRLLLLNRFLYKISKFPYLANSEEVKLFLSTKKEVGKALSLLDVLSDGKLLEKYKKSFPDFPQNYNDLHGKAKLKNFKTFLKKEIINIRIFREGVSQSLEKKEQYLDNYYKLIIEMNEYEKNTLKQFANGDENKLLFYNPKTKEVEEKVLKLKRMFKNPYLDLRNWFSEDELDVEAFIQALDSLDDLIEVHKEMQQKLTSLKSQLIAVNLGQEGLMKKFFKKRESLEKEQKRLEKNCMQLVWIVKYVTYHLETYSVEFKELKIKEYFLNLKKFAEREKENNKLMDHLWEDVKECLKTLKTNKEN